MIMANKVSYFLDALDNPKAKPLVRILSGAFWCLVLAGFCFGCLFFAYVFQ